MDTLGLFLGVTVHSAGIQDRDGAKLLLDKVHAAFGWLKIIWADSAYAGKLVDWAAMLKRHRWIRLDLVRSRDKQDGFKMLPKRWIVERTFGWRSKSRRLSKDYETTVESSETFILIAMTRSMVRGSAC